jgi:hypothetical protein
MRSFEEQLDHVAQLRPEGQQQGAWDAAVSGLLSRVAYLRHIASRHAPTALLHSQVLLMQTVRWKPSKILHLERNPCCPKAPFVSHSANI